MKKILQLFSILQLTKEQPLVGYLTAGIKLSETATLAEHHYTCGLMAFILGNEIKKVNPNFDSTKLLKMVLIHDLGELFGGDISSPLNRKYPDLREHKDKIGERAMDLITSYLDDDEFKSMFIEFENKTSDEAVVGKIIDQIDHQFFLEHHNHNNRYAKEEFDYRLDFTKNHVYNLPEKIQNLETRKVMVDFLENFEKNIYGKGFQAITFLMQE